MDAVPTYLGKERLLCIMNIRFHLRSAPPKIIAPPNTVIFSAAYTTCLKAVFWRVKELNPSFVVGETLLGILADWSDTQLKGLEDALGKDVVAKVMKGCQVGTP